MMYTWMTDLNPNDSRRFRAASEERCLQLLERLNKIQANYQIDVCGMSRRMDVSKTQLKKYVKSLRWKTLRIEAILEVNLRSTFDNGPEEGCTVDVVIRFSENG